jgi:hypothetical protein
VALDSLALRQQIIETGELSLDNSSPLVAAALLKRWFDELPMPLVPATLWPELVWR